MVYFFNHSLSTYVRHLWQLPRQMSVIRSSEYLYVYFIFCMYVICMLLNSVSWLDWHWRYSFESEEEGTVYDRKRYLKDDVTIQFTMHAYQNKTVMDLVGS